METENQEIIDWDSAEEEANADDAPEYRSTVDLAAVRTVRATRRLFKRI